MVTEELLSTIADTEVAPDTLVSNMDGGLILSLNRYKYKVAFDVSGFIILYDIFAVVFVISDADKSLIIPRYVWTVNVCADEFEGLTSNILFLLLSLFLLQQKYL